MFGWLVTILNRLLGREDRGIFRYWDGFKQRAIDPVLAYRQLMNDQECQLFSDVATARNPKLQDGSAMYPIEEVLAAEDRHRALTRKVFGLKEWNENQHGLTLDETDDVLNKFFVYCDELKKKRNRLPTSSPPIESTEPSFSSDGDGFPAGVDPDYCSSASESNVAAPTGP